MADTHEGEVRRAFLAGRDVACPKCGYNLRDGTGESCPECGLKIVLQVAGRRAWSAPAMFAFVAFGWALTAGVLNSVRNLTGLYEEASVPVQFAVAGPRIRVQGIIDYPRAGFSWDLLWSLPPGDWIDPVWSVTCALLAIVGLALLWRAVRSPAPSWRAARIVLIVLYGVYGGYHLVMFGRQMLGWW